MFSEEKSPFLYWRILKYLEGYHFHWLLAGIEIAQSLWGGVYLRPPE
jgi:hypothetical protein